MKDAVGKGYRYKTDKTKSRFYTEENDASFT